ncbi:uncharacterized protein zgc:174863 isoform X1 [Triplophysa rosa]|uniref:uncharacterized protein zgc:174863 isoform X1 n=1 Tax=Triplophysa rosa TaxID=992332 RepID=UPI0025460CCD|nr:uncharacterized protein zgc:174863 isoform X1 [Triplophysa rosa]
MASIMIMVLAVVCPFIPAVGPSGDLLKLECDPAVGIAAHTTVITCNFRDNKDVKISAVSLRKVGQNESIFRHLIAKQQELGDPRFSLENRTEGPSLKINDTMFSDAGVYEYDVVTNRGQASGKFSLSVTAKYKDPIVSAWPQNVTEGGPLDLYCNATEGYPAGTIHWFDRYGTNWTINSILTKTTKDTYSSKSVALSGKLTFKSIDLSLAPFRCIVLNNKYIQEGEKTIQITPAKQNSEEMQESRSNKTNIIAGVMVIGSLIAGLLFALLFFRKGKEQSYDSGQAAKPDVISDII